MNYLVKNTVAYGEQRQVGSVSYTAEGRFNSQMSRVLNDYPELVPYSQVLSNYSPRIHYYHYQNPFMMLHALKYLCEVNNVKSVKTFKEYVESNRIRGDSKVDITPDFLRYVRMMELVTLNAVAGCPKSD